MMPTTKVSEDRVAHVCTPELRPGNELLRYECGYYTHHGWVDYIIPDQEGDHLYIVFEDRPPLRAHRDSAFNVLLSDVSD